MHRPSDAIGEFSVGTENLTRQERALLEVFDRIYSSKSVYKMRVQYLAAKIKELDPDTTIHPSLRLETLPTNHNANEVEFIGMFYAFLEGHTYHEDADDEYDDKARLAFLRELQTNFPERFAHFYDTLY